LGRSRNGHTIVAPRASRTSIDCCTYPLLLYHPWLKGGCRFFSGAAGSLLIEQMTEVSNSKLNPFRSAPNLLTLLRICMAPFLVAAVLERDFRIGFILFVAAGLTDALDGILARVLKQRTMLGQYLDPVADKLLLSALFLVLMYEGLMPLRVTVLVFGRDVAILLVAAILYAAAGRREFTPSIFGKANTLAQIATVAVVLLYQLTQPLWLVALRTITLWATMILTVLSGLHYAWLAAHRSTLPVTNGHSAK
jgi:cardiolipin synthase (CMP-forming)